MESSPLLKIPKFGFSYERDRNMSSFNDRTGIPIDKCEINWDLPEVRKSSNWQLYVFTSFHHCESAGKHLDSWGKATEAGKQPAEQFAVAERPDLKIAHAWSENGNFAIAERRRGD
ncbi:hypothetical protein CEXT_669631 [Caerostris extrusa]|uniref:Uncharacterized protein n=1 Tax=Caerostris extrusa TaxID=172846 RepID=A0AAV4N4S2_CAEEX|nr:hypothetical protein CEXT_669631 [Caerostris extrusa]